jgi:hypothetical protein
MDALDEYALTLVRNVPLPSDAMTIIAASNNPKIKNLMNWLARHNARSQPVQQTVKVHNIEDENDGSRRRDIVYLFS